LRNSVKCEDFDMYKTSYRLQSVKVIAQSRLICYGLWRTRGNWPLPCKATEQ